MQIAFTVASFLFSLLFAFAWRHDNWPNAVIKAVLIVYAVWAFFMMCAQIAPYINSGTMRLI